MRYRVLSLIVCSLLLFSHLPLFAGLVQIEYFCEPVAQNSWQCTYDITNLGLPDPIMEFTVWFDPTLYSNLQIVSPTPVQEQWDIIILTQPNPTFSWDGAIDASAKQSGIETGNKVQGFSVSFVWLGAGVPGPQFYEIVNPVSFETISSGMTIPEPITALLVSMGGLLVFRTVRRDGEYD